MSWCGVAWRARGVRAGWPLRIGKFYEWYSLVPCKGGWSCEIHSDLYQSIAEYITRFSLLHLNLDPKGRSREREG